MKIRLLSDIHTEFKLPYKTHPMMEYRGEDVLVLAGDIASGTTNVLDVIKAFKRAGFPEIVVVAGNHEYYGTTVKNFNEKMTEKCKALDGVHFLNPNSVIIKDVQFIGGTLWSDFHQDHYAQQAAARCIADFRLIREFSTEKCAILHRDHKAFFKFAYEEHFCKKKVFVSHFLPTNECISPRFRGESMVNKYFANNMDRWVESLEDSVWLFGHTHDSLDFVQGKTRLVCNPHGYYNTGDANTNFDPFKTIEI